MSASDRLDTTERKRQDETRERTSKTSSTPLPLNHIPHQALVELSVPSSRFVQPLSLAEAVDLPGSLHARERCGDLLDGTDSDGAELVAGEEGGEALSGEDLGGPLVEVDDEGGVGAARRGRRGGRRRDVSGRTADERREGGEGTEES